jgi:cysteine synthase A
MRWREASDQGSILGLVGGTPLVRLRRCVPDNGAELWIKLEYMNPTGSMKDRLALAMVEGAERDGHIRPGLSIMDYTGGSTGAALAFVCRAKGHRCRIVTSECFGRETVALTRAFGAEIELLRAVEADGRVTPGDYERMRARTAELAARPDHHWVDQHTNPYIVPRLRDSLGAEVWQQTSGRVTAFCQGVGTATSLMGAAHALRPHGVTIQAHEPASSAGISGGPPGAFAIRGWTGTIPPLYDGALVDRVEPIGDAEALAMTARLAHEEGVYAGISSGANVVGAIRLAETLGPEEVIVTLAVDTGLKYTSLEGDR